MTGIFICTELGEFGRYELCGLLARCWLFWFVRALQVAKVSRPGISLLIFSFYGFRFGAAAGESAGFGMFGCPVLRGEGDAPEVGSRRRELQADFGFAGANRTEEGHVAFLVFLRALVLQIQFGAAGETGVEENERAVSVDGERLGFFVHLFALSVGAPDADGDLHENALATPAGAGTYRCVGSVAHTASLISTIRGGSAMSSESRLTCSGR